MEREHILAKINTKLAIFETEVRIANANSEYDINRHAQTMLIPVLDIVFGCEFLNLDYAEKRNFPAIDLGSPEKRLAVQVTSTGTTNKVAHSLEVFNKYDLGKEYSFLLFYFIHKPQKAISLSSRSIVKNMGRLEPNNIRFLTNDDLYKKLAGFSIDRLQAVLDILQKEYPDAAESLPSATALTPLPSYDHDTRLIGRDSILKDLKTVLMNSFPVIVLTGPGGIGKTSIAARLCHDIKEDSASVAWITYSDDLRSGLLKLELYQDLDPAQRLEHILRYLKTTSRPLYLFIDNMRTSFRQTDIGLINQFSPSVRVFITSRYRTSAFQCIRLRPLDLDAAAAMYEAYSKHTIPANERDDFKRLLSHTSSNTLLIELLAKFASRKFLTLTALMKQLESQGILSMNAGSLETVYSKKPMAIRDFVLDLYNISELSSEQKRILKLLSIFPEERPVTLKVAEWASFDMTELHHLSEWGWVKYSFGDAAPCNTADACPVKNTAVPSPDEKHIGLPKSLYLHSIIKDTVSAQDNAQLDFNNYGSFLRKVSSTHYYLGRGTPFSTTQEDIIVPEAVADYQLMHHMYDARTAYLCLNLSKSFKRNGDLEKAKRYVKKPAAFIRRSAAEILHRLPGPSDNMLPSYPSWGIWIWHSALLKNL